MYHKPRSNSKHKRGQGKGGEIEVQRTIFRLHISWYFKPRRVLRVHLLFRAAGSLCNHRIVEKMSLEVVWSSLLETGLTLKLGHTAHALSSPFPNISKGRDSSVLVAVCQFTNVSLATESPKSDTVHQRQSQNC